MSVRELTEFSFCETVTAGSKSKWHIRQLTKVGQKFGGGVDTPSLCGRIVAWDLEVGLTSHHLQNNTCLQCAKKYWEGRVDSEMEQDV